MRLDVLKTSGFRNLKELQFTPNPRFNVISGRNGEGKTNLIEAIYLLSSPRSFRPQTLQDLIQFDLSQASIEGRLERNGFDKLIKLDIAPGRRQIFVNHDLVSHQSSFFGTVHVVLFCPEDILLLKGGPAERRDFVDRILTHAQPAFLHEIDAYQRALSQRNALLKEESFDHILLDIYTEQLVSFGSEIISRRLDFLEHFAPYFQKVFEEIFDPTFQARLQYVGDWMGTPYATPIPASFSVQGSILNATESLDATPSSTPLKPGEIATRLSDAFQTYRDEEIRRGYTLVGPHRDDLLATLNSRRLKQYGSQGQHRGFVLAMKMAEIAYLESRYHVAPILLLDDVSSELDALRNTYLFDYLGRRESGQVFITTTDPNYIRLNGDLKDVNYYQMENGELCRAA